jgi:hypothetical protein
MGAYRELVHGLCFFACAMAGFVPGCIACAYIVRIARPPPNTPADLEMVIRIGGIIGAIAGGFAWLAFKYRTVKKPPA